MIVRESLRSELSWANHCYASIGFVQSTGLDLIVVAEVHGQRAGLGRIVAVDDVSGELGGIYVLPEFRGQAIARSIVTFLLERATCSRIYCIPFKHLESFYMSCGFAPVAKGTTVPASIAEKIEWCAATYPDPVVLLSLSAG